MLASRELDGAVIGDVVVMRRIRDGRITPINCEIHFRILEGARSSNHWFYGEPLNGPKKGAFDLERRNWAFVPPDAKLLTIEMERGDSD